MRLDRKQRQDLADRKGRTGRTLLQVGWFAISLVIAYFVTEWLFSIGYLTPASLYRGGVPRAIPEWAVQGVLMILITVVIQFFTIMGFMFGSPRGRGRLGRPSRHSWNPDPNDDRPY